jgi:hypothetical protein
VTWDQAVTWLIVPAVVGTLIAVGGIWLSRHMP